MDRKKARDRYARPITITVVICALVYGVCGWLRTHRHLEWLELWAYDAVIQAQPRPAVREADGDVVVIGIDEEDLRRLRHYPLTDQDKAELFDKLHAYGARAVGADIYMDLPTAPDSTDEKPDPGRVKLKEALARDREVVCPEYWGSGANDQPDIPPPPFVPRGRRVGCVDQPYDRDDKLRRALLYVSHGSPGDPGRGAAGPATEKQAEPTLSLDVVNKFLEADGTLKPDREDLIHVRNFWNRLLPRFKASDGPYVDEVAEGYQYLVNYAGPARFKTWSLRQVMDDSAGAAAFAGKAVVVGMTARSVKDLINTPLGLELHGVEHHALLIDRLIRLAHGAARPVGAMSHGRAAAWTLLWTLAAAAVGFRLRHALTLTASALAGLAVIILVAVLAFHHNQWVPVVPPVLCWLATLFGVTSWMVQLERADRAVVMDLFGRAVQKEVADEIWSRREELLEHGGMKPREMVATLIFTDLEDFTRMSEDMPPAKLIEWLNGYLNVMTEIVAAHHGIVAKYMGDGMMIVFGSPLTRTPAQDALDAVYSALAMRKAMGGLRRSWKKDGKPELRMRVGVFTGPVVSGSVGSARRSEYTTLGDTTNTASRLENYDKDLMHDDITGEGCRILIGEPTWQLVNHAVRTRRIGEVELKGKKVRIPVYGVIGRADDPAPPGPASGAAASGAGASSGGDGNAASAATVLTEKE